MYLYVIFLCQLLSLTGASGSGIIGGKEARRPYMVSLQANGHHVCGGMLIRKDFVLTSGHCMKSHPLTVVLGAHNINKKEKSQQRIQVAYYHRHPLHRQYNQLTYDIMLLKLKPNAKLNKFVKVIGLQEKNVEIPANIKCSVAGWGMMRSNSKVVEILREVKMIMDKSSECKNCWKKSFDPKQMICTRFEEKKGFLQGDSGGPLVCNKKAYGVVAYFANGDHNIKYPNVYMKIPFFMPWITEVLHGYGANLSNTV